MHICVDARPVEKPASRYRGIGLYTSHLCRSLLERNRLLEQPHSFTLIASRAYRVSNNEATVRQVPAIRKPSRLQWLLDRWTLPRVLKQDGFDVFHATEITSIPVCNGTKVIAHVHDMIPFLFWDQYARRIPLDYRYALQLAKERIAQAAFIITVSQHSKNDIAELIGYPEDRIYVAHEGPPAQADGETSPSEKASESPYPYFLYVGGTDFRKNVSFLIRAFARFAAREKDSRLMLVGETFMMSSLPEVAELLREIHRLGIARRVVIKGYVDDQTLRGLYCNSLALVFPSLYEGFGLPVLEAMTYGTPVLAARTSSIPEILSDTGLYFDPHNEDSLIAGLEAVSRDPTRRNHMIEKAKQRARLFSWNTVADVVFGIYEQF